jgi:predicted amidohydrolase YtcJ
MKGMEADLTVLDRDITALPADQITKAKVLMTIVGGYIVYDSSL